ncbi:TonB-dependent receptor [uncultured Porphyromonas sp.]|uniref:SusC/RagA family TonB-linked outer membrane protein n=1 Tax=uncultured Porphyromonas sp. TaxID=159274 RepID=UPI002607B121|nr:TonB-dependent receptor [uncultured Porphyromonas sp.]
MEQLSKTKTWGVARLMSLLLALVMLPAAQLLAQSVTLKGTVVDDLGDPVIGASVAVAEDTSKGALTNLDGEFTIPNAPAKGTLRISYVGMKTIEIPINGQTNFSITLHPDNELLDEVVVVGYTTQKRSEMTTSVAKLDNKVLESAPRSNAATALQGTIPGLRVSATTGQPGSTPSMVLRGGTDWNGGGSPLVLIDGVPGSFYALNADDIASIEVMKDAASTAVYGARAANGVIIVTTKKGKTGTSSIQVRAKLSTNTRPQDPMQYLSAPDYVRMNRLAIKRYQANIDPNGFEAYLSGNNGAATGNDILNGYYTIGELTKANEYLLKFPEWHSMDDPINPGKKLIFQDNHFFDSFFQPSFSQDYSINASGGNDKGTYYLGLGYLSDKGLVLGSSFTRFSGTFNGSYNITDKLRISSGVIYSLSNQNVPFDNIYNIFQRSAGLAPTTRKFYANPDGSNSDRPHPGYEFGFGNPLYYHDKFEQYNLEQRFTGNVSIDYKIIDQLTLTLRGSHFMINNNNESFNHAFVSKGSLNTTRKAGVGYDRTIRNQFTGTLNYRDTFREKHNLAVLLGTEYFINKYFESSASTKGSPTDIVHTLNAGAETDGKPTSSHSAYAIASLFGQINYDYDYRYLLGLTFRYDGTSRLAQQKYGFFPGISLGWNAHNETFYKESALKNYINTLKPRISYGVNGNVDVLGDYTVYGLYAGNGTYDSQSGYVNTVLPNFPLRWERSTTLNFGLDLGLLNNRITVTTEYFIRDVMDKLADKDLAYWSGFSTVKTNNGILQNRGIELAINADIIKTKDFYWSMGANFTSIKSYAKKLPNNGLEKNRQGGTEIVDPNDPKKTIWVGGQQEGERLGYDLVTAYIFDGVYKTQAELDKDKDRIVQFAKHKDKRFLGDARWKDLNGDGVIDGKDRKVMGRTTPWLIGGLNTNIGYKGFDLYIKTDFAIGHLMWNGRYIKGIAQTQGNQNGPVQILDTWSETNKDSNIPSYTFVDPQKNHQAGGGDQGSIDSGSSANLQKGDYLAIREVTLSYTYDKPLLGDMIKNVRLYLTGSNLHYFTAYNGSSPEYGASMMGAYPLPKTFTFGLNVTF